MVPSTRRSCPGWTNNIGTVTWLNADRTSQARMLRRRADSTFALTEEIADCTAAIIPAGGSAPPSNSLTALEGGVMRKQIGARNEQAERSQPRIGLEAKPAQITS